MARDHRKLKSFGMADVGEMSAVWTQSDTWGPFAVLYGLNSSGQEGIVMRLARAPWGPYFDPIKLYDCDVMRTALAGSPTNFPTRPAYSKCYGGYAYPPSLWTFGENSVTLRFNVSLWSPYKVMLVETTLTQ